MFAAGYKIKPGESDVYQGYRENGKPKLKPLDLSKVKTEPWMLPPYTGLATPNPAASPALPGAAENTNMTTGDLPRSSPWTPWSNNSSTMNPFQSPMSPWEQSPWEKSLFNLWTPFPFMQDFSKYLDMF